jgi:hypothetical protein
VGENPKQEVLNKATQGRTQETQPPAKLMKATGIAAALVLFSLPIYAGDNTFIQEQAHAFEQPTDLTLSNFFTDGWDQPWVQRVTPGGAPDTELLHVDTAFLERVFRIDYASEETTPGDRSIRSLDGVIAFALNRRIMLELAPSYEWKENHNGGTSSGDGGKLETRIQLVDVPGAAYAFKFSVSEPNHGIGSEATTFGFGLGGWNDLTGLGLKRVGVYYSLDETSAAGPVGAGSGRNSLDYTVALAKTWTAPETPLFGNFTTFAEVYGAAGLDGNTTTSSLNITPGIQFDLGHGNLLMAGVDLPLAYPHPFEATYRLTYIMNFDGKGTPEKQPETGESKLWTDWTGWHLPYWNFTLTEGWQTEYMFRGENLTPGADGFSTSELQASTPGFARDQTFTLGAWGGLQMGEGSYPGLPPTINGTPESGWQLSHEVGTGKYRPEDLRTYQKSYRELDLSAKYDMNLGSTLVAEAGDILYFSEYDAHTNLFLEAPAKYHFIATNTKYETQGYTRNNSGADRNEVYLKLSTNPNLWPHIIPSMTYYETFNEQKSYESFIQTGGDGTDYYRGRFQKVNAPDYGGYLEGRVDGYMSLLKRNGMDVLSLRPYVLLSVSFNDETEATSNFGRKYFTGWNDTEIGVKAPFQVNRYVTISGFLAYDHSLTTPDQSTSRSNAWTGGEVAVTF